MRKNKYIKGNPQLRRMLVREAARLMYEEGVKQYYDAKRLAAKRILGKGRNGCSGYRASDLPSNGEISVELAALVRFYEGDYCDTRLFNMRVAALEIMSQLTDYFPRLIGSVGAGNVRKGSDIDIHVFCDSLEPLLADLDKINLQYELKTVSIRKANKMVEYTHVYIDLAYPVELSVYPKLELRVTGRSSTDGKPIIRRSLDALLQLILDEHGDAWQAYINHDELAEPETEAETDTEAKPNTRAQRAKENMWQKNIT